MKLYFDANVLIHAIEGEDQAVEKLEALIDLAENGGCSIVTSELSLAEAMVGPLKRLVIEARDDQALARERLYRSFPEPGGGVWMLAIDRAILMTAAKLRAARNSLKLPDAIHLATDVSARCDVFVSGDKRLRAAAVGTASRHGSVCSLHPAELSALCFKLGI